MSISIHALRDEGDGRGSGSVQKKDEFLSTPSARRATVGNSQSGGHAQLFLSTPSARRATRAATGVKADILFLSTPSARRATYAPCIFRPCRRFLSTPSARRATLNTRPPFRSLINFYPRPPRGGRPPDMSLWMPLNYFYPRPPRGGRRPHFAGQRNLRIFLSTPSARRATANLGEQAILKKISIHALREEGDGCSISCMVGSGISIHALREEGDSSVK